MYKFNLIRSEKIPHQSTPEIAVGEMPKFNQEFTPGFRSFKSSRCIFLRPADPTPIAELSGFRVLWSNSLHSIWILIPFSDSVAYLWPIRTHPVCSAELSPYRGYLHFGNLTVAWNNGRFQIRLDEDGWHSGRLDWSFWAVLQQIKTFASKRGVHCVGDRGPRVMTYRPRLRRSGKFNQLLRKRLFQLVQETWIRLRCSNTLRGFYWSTLQLETELCGFNLCLCHLEDDNRPDLRTSCMSMLSAIYL